MERNTGRRFEEEATEQPVDYSKKYSERKSARQNPIDGSCKKEFVDNSKVDLFGDYAETDLDQPTDYSLRYAEDDTDDEEKQNPEYFSESVQEDTVKTYCTEGTPYETPFNFSTATSMSDLRLEDTKEPADSQKKLHKKPIDLARKDDLNYEQNLGVNCVERRSLLVDKEIETTKAARMRKPDCLSPEKLLDYYQSSSSDGFSRANSLRNSNGNVSKASSVETTDKMDSSGSERMDRGANGSIVNEPDSPTEGKSSNSRVDKEGKMVTFSRQDYYAEQTPLMFSRCSSLGSLSGFEQHSIHDDRSSVVSDFSRRTSGVVSPSELPDSPTQTVPPSPRTHKSQCTDFISKIPEEAVRPSVRHLSYSKCHVPRTSVFEDDIATFKEESTPIEFSTATSLSSLTIDDEMKITNGSKAQNGLTDSSDKTVKEDSCAEKATHADTEKDQEQVSDGDEDDEDMLAACISMGIQNNRYRQSFKTSGIQKPVQPESSMLSRCQRPAVLNSSKPNKNTIEVTAPDTVHVYCTEDTPADISPVGSQSNLSALSMPSVQEGMERIKEDKPSSEVESQRNDLSDESSNLSGEDEKILDACIQSGIPKVRQITPPPSCIPFTQKGEAATQRFNICGTPSSSPVESSGNKNLGKSLEHPTLGNDMFDDSPNHSDDEAVLNECIRSAMPKVRLNISTLTGHSLSQTLEKSKQTVRKPSCSASYNQSYAEQSKQKMKKPVAFDDNFSLSEEEEDIMLAQCIKSGMPKALNVSSNCSLASSKKQSDQHSKSKSTFYINKPFPIRNTIIQTQSTPKSFQNGPGSIFQSPKIPEIRRSALVRQNPSSSSCRKVSQTEQDLESCQNLNENNCRSPISNGTDEDEPCRNSKSNVAPSRHSSGSSLSEEGSLGSIEEWTLLELCISSGMPRSKYRLKAMKSESSNHEERDGINEDNYSICTYNSYVCKT